LHDDLHDKAIRISSSLSPHLIVASEVALCKVAAYFSDKGPRLRQAAVDLIRSIRTNPNSRVIPQTNSQFQDALALYERSSDKEWSPTDCSSFLIMRRFKITDALSTR
jgi:predicted nucleic acid-binding protein